LVIREIALGNRRFNKMARNIGAPRDRLSSRLKDLVSAGIVQQREYQSRPYRFEYELTAAGRDLVPVLHVLRAWGERWAGGSAPMEFLHCGHAFLPTVRCAGCGDQVHEDDLHARSAVSGWSIEGPTAEKHRLSMQP
jgi:DNA-binding HxlR family transcriptional regulator